MKKLNHFKKIIFTSLALSIIASSSFAADFSLKISGIKNGDKIPNKFIFNSFGCSGKNISPEISWVNPPKDAKSFALTVYDPDAPTGSGWWHWLLVNIPAKNSKIPASFGDKNNFVLKEEIRQIRNDYGAFNYGGPCPPIGDKPHRYIFTIHALKAEKLDLSESDTAAKAGYFINQNSLASAKIEAFFGR